MSDIVIEKSPEATGLTHELRHMIDQAREFLESLARLRQSIDMAVPLDGTTAMRLFALFAGLDRAVGEVVGQIQSEIQPPASGRDPGRLQQIVLQHMQDSGIKSTNIEGLTVHLQSQLWASGSDMDVLQAHPDTAPMVKPSINSQTLSSWVRELPKDDDGLPILPPELVEAIRVSQVFSVRTRK